MIELVKGGTWDDLTSMQVQEAQSSFFDYLDITGKNDKLIEDMYLVKRKDEVITAFGFVKVRDNKVVLWGLLSNSIKEDAVRTLRMLCSVLEDFKNKTVLTLVKRDFDKGCRLVNLIGFEPINIIDIPSVGKHILYERVNG